MANNQNNNIPANLQQTVFNAAHSVAKNLRFIDTNGDSVSRQYTNDYLDNAAQNTSKLIDQYNGILGVLAQYETAITTLTLEVEALQTSGNALPNVSAGCYSSGNTVPITTAVNYLISSTCSYNTVLDTPTNLALSILEQGSSLNNARSFANPSKPMSSISGWNVSPATVANTINNLWLTVLDLRAGMTQVFSTMTPSCAHVIVNYASFLPNYTTGINLYFSGYAFIPSGYTDIGSTIQVTDSAGNVGPSIGVNIVTASTSTTPTNYPITGTPLLPNSNYTITVTSRLNNATYNVTCQKVTIQTVVNTISTCPTFTFIPSTTSLTYIMTPYITSNVSYVVNLTTSGGTFLTSGAVYANPSGPVSGTFGALSQNTTYGVQVITTVTGQAPVTCSTNTVTTT